MKAAVVTELGKAPVFAEFREPSTGDGDVMISVKAASLSQLTRGRASGTHYSTAGAVPFVVGVDGVGKLPDGRRVFFALPEAPFGSMAERVAIRARQTIPLPDNLDDVTAAAIANPGMSSWAALTERAKLQAGETVLINGATGTSGRLAVQIARHLGAKRVVATGRNPNALAEAAKLGADATIAFGENLDAAEDAFKQQFTTGIDVVLDYLWGPSAEHLLKAAAHSGEDTKPIRFVQIGSVSGTNITLPSPVLRSTAIVLMGSGIGSVPFDRLLHSIAGVFEAAVPAKFKVDTQVVPLTQVEQTWTARGNENRVVFTI